MLTGLRLFFTEFGRSFRSTGAIMPSSPALTRAILKPLRTRGTAPVKILEVGPGTGAFTFAILKHLRPGDVLHIYEINARFYHYLEHKLEQVRKRYGGIHIELHHADIRELSHQSHYHYIVSGLPFANFDEETVVQIMEIYLRHLAPGGILTYFEYLLPHRLRLHLLKPHQREPFKRLLDRLQKYTKHHQAYAEHVWFNFPPARARHLTHRGYTEHAKTGSR